MKKKIYFLSIPVVLIGIVVLAFFGDYFTHLSQKEIQEMPKKEYTQTDVENLAVLGKIWGFMKYYHPAVRAGKYDWDRELLSVMPSLVSVSSREKRNEILTKWVDEFDVRMKPGKKVISISADSVKMYPDLGWIEDTATLGRELSDKLKEIADAERDTTSYYVKLKKDETGLVGSASFEQEEAYPECTFPTINYQLLSLFRLWNAVQYYSPYKYLLKENWEKTLIDYIPLFLKITDRGDYEDALKRFIAEIDDAHTWLMGGKTKKYLVPVMVRFIEGKAVVTRNYDLKSGCRDSVDWILQPGDVLMRVNTEPVDSLVKRITPYVSASNEATLLRDIAVKELLYSNDTVVYVDYERDGIVEKAKLRCVSSQSVDPLVSYKTSQPLATTLPSDILYLWMGSSLGGKMASEIKAKGVIIDLRGYPTHDEIDGYWEYETLYPAATECTMFTFGSTQYPGLFSYSPVIKAGKKNKNYYKGKKVILVNELTQSQSEYLTMKYRCTPNTLVMGSMTAGADGNMSGIMLPGNLGVTFSGLGVYYPDKTETQQVGIVPDMEVKNTIQGIREGRDEVLEAAIDYLNN